MSNFVRIDAKSEALNGAKNVGGVCECAAEGVKIFHPTPSGAAVESGAGVRRKRRLHKLRSEMSAKELAMQKVRDHRVSVSLRKKGVEARWPVTRVLNHQRGGWHYELEGEAREKFIELYSVSSNADMVEWFGISYPLLQRFRKELGLEKDLTLKYKRCGAKLREAYRRERLRLEYGLWRTNHMRIGCMTAQMYNYRWSMAKRFNYYRSKEETDVIYWDNETRRNLAVEERAKAAGVKVLKGWFEEPETENEVEQLVK